MPIILEGAAREIDASGLLALPGGIDSHVHIAQAPVPRRRDGRRFCLGDACGRGRRQHHGAALRAPGEGDVAADLRGELPQARGGECYIDAAFHLIISDPTAVVLGQELPALVKDGYTSFKVFMTYDDLVLNDKQLLEVFDVARREEALVMVHCEGYDAIRFLTT